MKTLRIIKYREPDEFKRWQKYLKKVARKCGQHFRPCSVSMTITAGGESHEEVMRQYKEAIGKFFIPIAVDGVEYELRADVSDL